MSIVFDIGITILVIFIAIFCGYIVYTSRKSHLRNILELNNSFKNILKNSIKYESVSTEDRKRLEPFLYYHELGKPKISFDPNYLKFMIYWKISPTLDATYASLEILKLLDFKPMFSEEKIEENNSFLLKCFIDKGAFAINTNKRFSSIYATNCAVGIIKALLNIDCEEKLPALKDNKVFIPKRKESILTFIKKCETHADHNTLLVDNLQSGSGAHFINLYTAHRLFWNLQSLDDFYSRIVPKDEIIGFILNEFKRIDFNGFPANHSSDKGCICAIKFALSLLSQLEALDKLSKSQRRKIIKFIHDCFYENENGFSTAYGDSASLHGTWFALDALRIIGCDFEEKEILLEFVKDCYTNAGFAFHKSFSANIFATRLALLILTRLGEMGEELKQELRDQLIQYVEKDLYDKSQNAYWGEKPKHS